MPHIRDVLNEIKWTKDLKKVKIWYIHRGAPHNTQTISGTEIIRIGRSFLETTTTTIPYHRIYKIVYNNETVFNRWTLHHHNKQL